MLVARGTALGFAFVFISLLSKAGYVEINYTKVERDLLSLLDLNKDGLVDRAEYEFASKRLVSLLVDHGISSTAGLCVPASRLASWAERARDSSFYQNQYS